MLPGALLPVEPFDCGWVLVPELPAPDGVPGVVLPDTPVAGGVVGEVTPVLGGHGTAAPLVPTAPGVEEVSPVPCAEAVCFGPLCCAATAADVEPVCASGPASVALLVVPFTAVGVPVELFTCACGSFAAATRNCADSCAEPAVVDPAVCVERVVPVPAGTPAPVVGVAAPVTGTHGVVDAGPGVVVGRGVGVPGCEPALSVAPDPDWPCWVPGCVAAPG